MNQLLAYHNNPAIKAKYIARVREHRKMDQLIKGTGWENGKGCAIGCTLENYDHARYPIEMGIPESLARLEDRIFEGLPNDRAMKWPELFLRHINPGADLSLVTPKILLWILTDENHGVRKIATNQSKAAIDLCADVMTCWIRTGTPNQAAAEAAAEAAAWAAAWAAARAAEAAARAAARAVRAAGAAAEAAARAAGAAEEEFYTALGTELLRLLKICGPTKEK